LYEKSKNAFAKLPNYQNFIAHCSSYVSLSCPMSRKACFFPFFEFADTSATRHGLNTTCSHKGEDIRVGDWALPGLEREGSSGLKTMPPSYYAIGDNRPEAQISEVSTPLCQLSRNHELVQPSKPLVFVESPAIRVQKCGGQRSKSGGFYLGYGSGGVSDM